MASVRIPKAARNGLRILASLSEQQFADLRAALQSLPLEIRHHSIFADREVSAAGITEADLEALRHAIFPVALGASSIPVSLSEYIDDVIIAVNEEEPLSAEQSTLVRERLNESLTIPSLQLVAKAYDVLTEHGSAYVSCRVVSDVRHVFGDNVEKPPTAAVVVHMLNINYSEGTLRKTFVVALDNKDIDELSEALERAKKKRETLKSVILSAGIKHIDVI
jgi:hypothetical protein